MLLPSVPAHDGHKINKHSEPAQNQGESDIPFATRAICIVVPHAAGTISNSRARESGCRPISLSAIRAANNAAR